MALSENLEPFLIIRNSRPILIIIIDKIFNLFYIKSYFYQFLGKY